jgi:hypothetical protein
MLMGYGLENVSAGIDCVAMRQSIGVCAAIAPFNFPAMVPLWFLPFAVACGNTFILKPSEQVPLSQQRIFELLEKCDLPPGVVNLVHGGREVATICDRRHSRGTLLGRLPSRAVPARHPRRQARPGSAALRTHRHAGRGSRWRDSNHRRVALRLPVNGAWPGACCFLSAKRMRRRAIGSWRPRAHAVGDGPEPGVDIARDQRATQSRAQYRPRREGRRDPARRPRPRARRGILRRADGIRSRLA